MGLEVQVEEVHAPLRHSISKGSRVLDLVPTDHQVDDVAPADPAAQEMPLPLKRGQVLDPDRGVDQKLDGQCSCHQGRIVVASLIGLLDPPEQATGEAEQGVDVRRVIELDEERPILLHHPMLFDGEGPTPRLDVGDIGRGGLGPVPGDAPEKGRELVEVFRLLLAGALPEEAKLPLDVLGRYQSGQQGDLIDSTSAIGPPPRRSGGSACAGSR